MCSGKKRNQKTWIGLGVKSPTWRDKRAHLHVGKIITTIAGNSSVVKKAKNSYARENSGKSDKGRNNWGRRKDIFIGA